MKLGTIRNEAVASLLKTRSENVFTEEGISEVFRKLRDTVFGLLGEPIRECVRNPLLDVEELMKQVAIALRSRKLLRFQPKTEMADNHCGPETVFEKRLAQEAEFDNSNVKCIEGINFCKWANQIPIWSGICDVGGKANIDFGHSPSHGEFWLYELKINDKNPLYAMVELFTYALGYFVIRRLATLAPLRAQPMRARCSGLLDAKNIYFRVIAPRDFYTKRLSRDNHALSRDELEIVRVAAIKILARLSDRLGFNDLKTDMAFQKLDCATPKPFRNPADRDTWIEELRRIGGGSLRNLICKATPL